MTNKKGHSMSAAFKVWTEGWNGRDDPTTVEAYDAGDAAEKFVERNHGNFDYCSDCEVFVIDLDGKTRKYTVFVESHPVFTAKEEVQSS